MEARVASVATGVLSARFVLLTTRGDRTTLARVPNCDLAELRAALDMLHMMVTTTYRHVAPDTFDSLGLLCDAARTTTGQAIGAAHIPPRFGTPTDVPDYVASDLPLRLAADPDDMTEQPPSPRGDADRPETRRPGQRSNAGDAQDVSRLRQAPQPRSGSVLRPSFNRQTPTA